jgi:hypothetical protein
MTNVQKLECWIKDQKENHGLIDIKLSTIYDTNNFLDYLALNGHMTQEQATSFYTNHQRPSDVGRSVGDMAGEILAMLNVPKLEDREFF